MSVQTELDRIIGLVHESHEKAQAKGGTATTPLLANLPGVIESIPQGVELPELGDTAAQPTDMVAGKVLYDDDGNPVTGTLLEANEIQEKIWATSDYYFSGTAGGTTFHVSGMYNGSSGVPDGLIVRPGAGLGVRNAPTDFFGDATAADVAAGKTFTSAAGLLVTGTASGGGSGVNVVPITLSGIAGCGFDADGNVIYSQNGTYNFLEGIIYIFDIPKSVSGSYVSPDRKYLYRFTTPGTIYGTNQGGTGGGGGN